MNTACREVRVAWRSWAGMSWSGQTVFFYPPFFLSLPAYTVCAFSLISPFLTYRWSWFWGLLCSVIGVHQSHLFLVSHTAVDLMTDSHVHSPPDCSPALTCNLIFALSTLALKPWLSNSGYRRISPRFTRHPWCPASPVNWAFSLPIPLTCLTTFSTWWI